MQSIIQVGDNHLTTVEHTDHLSGHMANSTISEHIHRCVVHNTLIQEQSWLVNELNRPTL